jgi:glycyl-tRNA synthetase alpha chain
MNMQSLIMSLQNFWSSKGCAIVCPFDKEMGAGTFHPNSVLKALGKKPWRVAYVQPSRRPSDGRYGENPNRVQRHHQFQVLIKPSPENSRDLYLESLESIGISQDDYDIRFVEDNWESPTLGASGLGYEVWCNGMEITQFTYFQTVGGIDCDFASLELTYGLERVAMILQNKSHINELDWNGADGDQKILYEDLFKDMEVDHSFYNFEYADIQLIKKNFDDSFSGCVSLLEMRCLYPAYEYFLQTSHFFNILDARGSISVADRAEYISQIRSLAKRCCELYLLKQVY